MVKISKPMLAATLQSMDTLNFPVLCSPKIDGIRCLIVDGKARTRTFKAIPNVQISKLLSKLPNNLDGELFVRDFATTSSSVMSVQKENVTVTYYVFDYVPKSLKMPYFERMEALRKLKLPTVLKDGNCKVYIKKLLPQTVESKRQLLSLQKRTLKAGFEGVMIRRPQGEYKLGRATSKSGDLSKLKVFKDAEAKVVGFEEGMHNGNVVQVNAVGARIRSSKKEFKKGRNSLGALHVKGKNGVEFKIGTGFDEALRRRIWKNKKSYMGQWAKYKYFEINGDSGAPRFPVFIGFRSKLDM